jgi:hypothetical protein
MKNIPLRVILCFWSLSLISPSFAKGFLSPRKVASIWNTQENYSKTKVSYLNTTFNFPTQVPLTLVVLEKSGWSKDEVLSKLKRTQEVYAQCEVSFSPILLIESKNVHGSVVDLGSPFNVFANLKVEQEIPFLKPAVYFLSQEAKHRFGGGYSWRVNSPGGRLNAQKRNSAFVYSSIGTTESRSTSLSETRHGYYEVLAHEIAHLLLDQSHTSTAGHLMAHIPVRTNTLTKDQCVRIHANLPAVKQMLSMTR